MTQRLPADGAREVAGIARVAGVWLDLWPGGHHGHIASAGYHGRPVEWEGW